MRKTISLNPGWMFTLPGKKPIKVDVPHTWNNIDGQDGGTDYLRTTALYEKTFENDKFIVWQ